MKYLLIAIVASLLLVGCATHTDVKQIGSKTFVVCDEGGKHCTGANPEKGLPDTCFAIGRTIEEYHEIQNNALAVTCGPLLRSP